MTTYQEFDLQDKFYSFKLGNQISSALIVERVLSNKDFRENKTPDGRFIEIHELSRWDFGREMATMRRWRRLLEILNSRSRIIFIAVRCDHHWIVFPYQIFNQSLQNAKLMMLSGNNICHQEKMWRLMSPEVNPTVAGFPLFLLEIAHSIEA